MAALSGRKSLLISCLFLCHLPTHLKSLRLMVHRFFGMVVPPLRLFYQPPTLPYNACLCPPLVFKPGGEKSPHLLVDLHLPWAESFQSPFLCLCGAIFEVGRPFLCRGKEVFLRGAGLSPAFCARLDSQALCLPCRKQENFAIPIVTP